jgi:hypothetical protein
MQELKFNPQSPKKFDKTLEALASYLGIVSTDAVHLKFSRPSTFTPEPQYCHFNVWCQMRSEGGAPQPGWIFAQDKNMEFAEAIFHAVWRAPDGRLVDVTPRKDLEKRLLFVPDARRAIVLTSHEGQPAIHTFQNVRVFRGRVVTPLTEFIAVMTDDFPQRQGLWPW